jgi:DNA-binding LytR/AlgR family response regulator
MAHTHEMGGAKATGRPADNATHCERAHTQEMGGAKATGRPAGNATHCERDKDEFRVALCEDNPAQRENIAALLRAYQAHNKTVTFGTDVFNNGAELLAREAAYDLYLLDILMPGIDGIALARTIRERDTDTPVIFLTSSPDYALEAFSVSAFRYLLKPVKRDEFFAALDKIIRAREREEKFIMVQTAEHMRRIPFDAIEYVELWGRRLKFSLAEGEALTSRAVRMSFSSAIAPIMADERFLHAHMSYVINMGRVHELRPRSFVMASGAEIPIPRHKYTAARNSYLDYLSRRGIGTVRHVH